MKLSIILVVIVTHLSLSISSSHPGSNSIADPDPVNPWLQRFSFKDASKLTKVRKKLRKVLRKRPIIKSEIIEPTIGRNVTEKKPESFESPLSLIPKFIRDSRCKNIFCHFFYILNYFFVTVLSIFTIVRFANDACPTTSGNNGTCYTA